MRLFKNLFVGLIEYPDRALTPCVAKDGIIGGNLLSWFIESWIMCASSSESLRVTTRVRH